MSMDLVFVLKWLKSVLGWVPYIFYLSNYNHSVLLGLVGRWSSLMKNSNFNYIFRVEAVVVAVMMMHPPKLAKIFTNHLLWCDHLQSRPQRRSRRILQKALQDGEKCQKKRTAAKGSAADPFSTLSVNNR